MLYVLAGVNGAGKSSIGGRHLLETSGLAWFNPDTFAREYRATSGCRQEEANALAWQEGMRRFDAAIAGGTGFAFETTLGGRSVAAKIRQAAASHDVAVWYCGLASPEQHIARVRARVAAGGHDIPEAKIRERCRTSLANLIGLLPWLASLAAYDNSVDVAPGEAIPDPVLVLDVFRGAVQYPDSSASLAATPDWAKALVEAALRVDESA